VIHIFEKSADDGSLMGLYWFFLLFAFDEKSVESIFEHVLSSIYKILSTENSPAMTFLQHKFKYIPILIFTPISTKYIKIYCFFDLSR